MPSAAAKSLAKLMRDLDFCMLTTRRTDGTLHARPMSNNREVEFDGDVWFFTASDSNKVREIEADPRVSLSFADPEKWTWVSLTGRASVIHDADRKRELWVAELEQWFDGGPESPQIALIRISAGHAEYWNGEVGGEVDFSRE